MADDSSFEQFAAEAAGRLHRTAWLLTADAHAAEDLVQESLARVYVRWRERTPIDNPVAYVRTVLVRQFISGRRRRSSTELVTDVLPETGVPPTMPLTSPCVRRSPAWTLATGPCWCCATSQTAPSPRPRPTWA